MKIRKLRKIMVVVLAVCLSILLCACGRKTKEYAGTWIGQEGSVLILNADGTCKYTEIDEDEVTDGFWSIEDNKVLVKDCLDYEIYAEIGESENALLFQADDSNWNNELLVKSN